MLDEYGCVVGVNTSGIGGTDDGQVITGINFAIPVNDLRRGAANRVFQEFLSARWGLRRFRLQPPQILHLRPSPPLR